MWFKVGDIKNTLITPIYTLGNDNLGFVAFAVDLIFIYMLVHDLKNIFVITDISFMYIF